MNSLSNKKDKALTLIELLVTLSILSILAASILPLAKLAVKREKEIELRENLRIMREAIDQYKRLADEKKIKIEPESEGYPPDLQTLVNGVELLEPKGKIIKFLRRVPLDPMTNSYDWGLRSYQDSPDSKVWGGKNVWDVYTKSEAIGLDGTKYNTW
ncbi:MAG: type II secretion system protein [Acidobacteriota bacterium]